MDENVDGKQEIWSYRTNVRVFRSKPTNVHIALCEFVGFDTVCNCSMHIWNGLYLLRLA